MFKIILSALLFCSGATACDVVQLNWAPPTTRENGKALTLGEIKSYTVRVRHEDDSAYYVEVILQANVGALHTTTASYSSNIENDILKAGNNCFSMNTIDVNDVASVYSGEVCAELCPSSGFDLIIDLEIIIPPDELSNE